MSDLNITERLAEYRAERTDNFTGWRAKLERLWVRAWGGSSLPGDVFHRTVTSEVYQNLLDEAIRQLELVERGIDPARVVTVQINTDHPHAGVIDLSVEAMPND